MKIKCMHCEEKYDVESHAQCPKCGKRGGYMQEPKSKVIGHINVHLEDVLIHEKTNNKYQVKEIQSIGLIATLVESPVTKVLVKVYISNGTISEYKI
jgi:DNA-directed RNA polymerase subunit RPC12/RpoP